LLLLVGPSLGLLYSSSLLKVNDSLKPYMTLKVVGAMWYWTYQYPSAVNFSFDAGTFDSYLVDSLMVRSKSTFKEYMFYFYRNLAVDELLTLPTFKKIRLLITSQDTIHCWAVPSLAIKLDACPGRINQVYLQILREGFFFGQCSELCGVNHSFMPINVRSVHLENLFI
jgi:heme/copper-type cytochrome/quinol oxidase subunit 2